MALSSIPQRLILPNVPRVHFYEGESTCPEDIPFAACLRSALTFLGEQPDCQHSGCGRSWGVACSYAYFLTAAGAAFALTWRDGLSPDNQQLHNFSPDPGLPYRLALEAAGYTSRRIEKSSAADDRDYLRAEIAASLQRAHPVIGFGVVGPPEACLITGLDEQGEILTGWSFFQQMPEFSAGLSFEPNGCFRQREWYENLHSLVLIEDKTARPPVRQVLQRALLRSADIVGLPKVGEFHNGLAAYSAWAASLLEDDAFRGKDEAELNLRCQVHNAAVSQVAEARWYAARCLAETLEHLPYAASEDLLGAAALYTGEHHLMWEIWDLTGGPGNPRAHLRLAEPGIRSKIALRIQDARQKDARALEHLQRAVRTCS